MKRLLKTTNDHQKNHDLWYQISSYFMQQVTTSTSATFPNTESRFDYSVLVPFMVKISSEIDTRLFKLHICFTVAVSLNEIVWFCRHEINDDINKIKI